MDGSCISSFCVIHCKVVPSGESEKLGLGRFRNIFLREVWHIYTHVLLLEDSQHEFHLVMYCRRPLVIVDMTEIIYLLVLF